MLHLPEKLALKWLPSRNAILRIPLLNRWISPARHQRAFRPQTPAAKALAIILTLSVLRMAFPEVQSGRQSTKLETAAVQMVLDGDTFDLADGRRVRMLGIDAPETGNPERPAEPLADASKDWLRSRLAARRVSLEITGADRYGRCLAWVYATDGSLVNLSSLSEGMSRLLDDFGLPVDLEPSLRQAESEARILRRGIWKSRYSGERKNRT